MMVKHREKRGWIRTGSDILFGIFLPVLCVVFDPIVFRSSLIGKAVLADYSLMGYLALGAALLFLSLWILFERYPAFFGGLLLGSALNALLLGLAILPVTIVGLCAIIGILGLLPFLASHVYWRNALDAFAMARQAHGRDVWFAPIIGLVVAVCIPAAVQGYFHGLFHLSILGT
jgi:hypothetical protein